MTRLEFPGKIKDQAFARAAGYCEKCGITLGSKRPEYDHRLPDALGGKPTLANCWVLCTPCHSEKTAKEDVPRIRKADRQRKNHVGATTVSKAKIARPPKAQREHKAPVVRQFTIYKDVEQ
jgi:5-methylcytosine-specific restriction endonuclease McrA